MKPAGSQTGDTGTRDRGELTNLFKILVDGILVIDAQGVVLFANPPAEALLGKPPGGAVGYPIGHPVADGNSVEINLIPNTLDPETVELRCIETTWEDAPAFFVNLRSITETRRTQQELRHSEERYRFLADNTLDCIWMLEPDFTVTYVNPAIEDIFGFTPEEYIGTNISDHCDEKHLEEIRQIVAAELSKPPGTSRVRFETALKHRRGHNVPVEITGRIICDELGRPVAIQGTTRDMTERKRAERERREAEEQLRQVQKLESIGQLAGGIAHDFNNMLGVILGYGEELISKLEPSDPLHAPMGEIVAAGRRSAALTRQLLAFSRRQTMQSKVVNLNHLVADMESMLRRLIGEDIALTVRLDEAVYPVEVDPAQIEQAIMNLAVNARDAMPRGGKLIIETTNVTLDEAYAREKPGVDPGRYVQLSVTDTGCGMEQTVANQVFEPFFTTKNEREGTGLGLSMVYGIVKQSGGNIWVYSEPEKGTAFKIYLPRHPGDPAMKGPETIGGATRGAGESVLVVEDEPSLRKLCVGMLKRLNYDVVEADSGPDALALLETEGLRPDLVITDVVMPEMSGKDLADRLEVKLPEVKVLFMSGYTDEAVIQHGVFHMDAPFIQKPFSRQELAVKVKGLLQPQG